jgi:WS/DGAT/MGAT family acyltransferase
LKLHHCVVDGMESVELMTAMHDLVADSPLSEALQQWRPDPLPSTAELVTRTALNGARYPWRLGMVMASAVANPLRPLGWLRGAIGGLTAAANPASSFLAPTTRFNQSASPHRVFEARFHDLADFTRIKAAVDGATINDVALAYVGGALRLYLGGRDELPDDTLVTACPKSIRSTSEKGGGGNRLFGRLQPLATHIEDPLERLAAIVAESLAFREGSDSERDSRLMDLVGTVPTALLGLTVKAASALPFSGPTIANTTVSNVPGPTEPVYFAGARLVRVGGLGPLIGGMNLYHLVASYHGEVSICATSNRSALPDPGHYAECMQKSFDELRSAVR